MSNQGISEEEMNEVVKAITEKLREEVNKSLEKKIRRQLESMISLVLEEGGDDTLLIEWKWRIKLSVQDIRQAVDRMREIRRKGLSFRVVVDAIGPSEPRIEKEELELIRPEEWQEG